MNNDFYDEVGGFESYRYKRTKVRREYMGLGPRRKDNDLRSRQGKIVNPKNIKCGTGTSGQTSPQKTYDQKKYSGPNYPQKDTTIVGSGMK